MARQLLLFSTIFSLFVLGYFLPRWTGPANCINSSLVEEITIEESSQSVLACNFREASFATPPPHKIQQLKVLERVEALDVLADYWGYPQFKIAILIEDGLKPKLNFREDKIVISVGSLQKQGVLEKAVMQYWLGQSDFMAAEVITSTMWNIFNNKKVFPQKSWLKDYSSLGRYCQRENYILQHSEYCQIHNELNSSLVEAQSDSSPVIWSLSHSISEVLTETFYNLNLEDKRKFLQNLIFLNSFDDISLLVGDADADQGLLGLDSRFEALIQYAVAPMDIPTQYYSRAALKKFANGRNYEMVILNPDVQADFRTLYFDDSKDVILEQAGQKQIYPSDTGYFISRYQLFNNQQIESLTLVGCEIPRPRRLLEFEGAVKEVLFVRLCEDLGQIQEIIESGAKNYVKKDSDIEFIEFNLAALKVASENRGSLRSSNDIQDWQKWLQWSDYVYDDDSQAYRPRAVYDGVTLFR